MGIRFSLLAGRGGLGAFRRASVVVKCEEPPWLSPLGALISTLIQFRIIHFTKGNNFAIVIHVVVVTLFLSLAYSIQLVGEYGVNPA